MSDASQHLSVHAKLKELIERASTAAENNCKNGHRVTPQGFAIRENGSRFVFEPIPPASNAEMASIIRATFAQEKVVCYVLITAASSEGKQFVLFTAEDEFGLMVGRREFIMQPAHQLAPLEITNSDFAEGRYVGLLPHRGPVADGQNTDSSSTLPPSHQPTRPALANAAPGMKSPPKRG